ncbi:MAG: CoA ester lyase [Planctomycetes bacterium]|nr:CoA ester lyase [Planctomycetota bacterium]
MIRSMLFLPGNNPNMLINGGSLGADAVIFDLEDAIAPEEKDAARILVRHVLASLDFSGRTIIVRINALDTPYWEQDVETMLPLGPDILMPTKVSGGDYIKTLVEKMREVESGAGLNGKTALMPLIETALGLENAFAIATAGDRVTALYLGAEDLTADLRCGRTKEGGEIAYARSRLVNAARAAGKDVFDTPFTDIDDLEGLRRDAALAKALGFTGKAVISPRHIDPVNEIFSPSAAEIEYAHRVFAAIEEAKRLGKGAISLNGKMIDAPVVERARTVLAAAADLNGGR